MMGRMPKGASSRRLLDRSACGTKLSFRFWVSPNVRLSGDGHPRKNEQPVGLDAVSSPVLAVPFDVEEFWEDLLAFVEDRHVIPVVGGELLTIEDKGRTVPLYRTVAERLLDKYRNSA